VTEVKEFKDSYNAEIGLPARMLDSCGLYINNLISSRVLRSLLGLTGCAAYSMQLRKPIKVYRGIWWYRRYRRDIIPSIVPHEMGQK